MPFKHLHIKNKYRRTQYRLNSAHFVRKVRQHKLKIRAWFEEYKSSLSCTQCGEQHPATLDFHHVRPSQKKISVAQLVAEGYSRIRIEKELTKCKVLCSNCHRKLHYKNNNL